MIPPAELEGMSGPGVGTVRIDAIDRLAAKYVKERDKRCRQTPLEVAAKTELIDEMHKHEAEIGRDPSGVLRYEYEDLVIELKPGKETLRVRAVGDDGDDE